jgi:acyl carrier protein
VAAISAIGRGQELRPICEALNWESTLDLDAIKQKLKSYILQEFLPGENPDALNDDVALVTDGILDSLASLKLVSYLEEEFGIEVAAHEVDADHLNSLDLIARFVLEKRG